MKAVETVISQYDWTFCNRNFIETIREAQRGDMIYCAPPYYGRHVDYYNGWTEDDERQLFEALRDTEAYFVLSTWHHNEFRSNDMIDRYWGQFNVSTQEHFYHGGGHVENRHAMTEALIYNFELGEYIEPVQQILPQLELEFAI